MRTRARARALANPCRPGDACLSGNNWLRWRSSVPLRWAVGARRAHTAWRQASPGATARDTSLTVLSAHTSQPGGESALATQARPPLHGHFLHAVEPSTLEGAIGISAWVSQAGIRAPSQEALQAPLASMSVHQTALLSPGDWPWRKLHCTVDADGVHVWLRDATIGAEDNALLDWIGQLRQALAQSGARLASFTLNGTAISPIA